MVARNLVTGMMNSGGPRLGWERLRFEAKELRAFLAHAPAAGEGEGEGEVEGEGGGPAGKRRGRDDNDSGGMLRSFYFANFLGPREYHWDTHTVSPEGRRRLEHALAAREVVLEALDSTDYEVQKQSALAGAGLRYVRYGSVPPWLAERQGPVVQDAVRNPRHPFFDPDSRTVRQAGFGTSGFSKLVQWSFDPIFNEPDFTDGLAAAFHAVTSRLGAIIEGGGVRGDDGLERMIHPKLLAGLEDIVTGQVRPMSAPPIGTAPRTLIL
jgi:hypothetical protein